MAPSLGAGARSTVAGVKQPLPMFPLGTVLFPGVSMPLRVFEDRYRAMVHHLLRLPDPTDPTRLQHESGLGIPLIKVLTDDVTFEPAGDGTIVSMTLKRPPAPPI